eukprot:jgi/Psemu1/23920/gm1.23920_g
MTATAVSWNEVQGIQFSFGPNSTAGNRQGDLNAVFFRILPNISSLFIVDDDSVETLRPDPIPVLKSLIVAAIVDELPPSEPTAPVVSETLPVPSRPTIVPSGTTGLVHTKTIDSNNVKTSLNSTAPCASRYTWTCTYSPNSDSVSFHRVQSNTISF